MDAHARPEAHGFSVDDGKQGSDFFDHHQSRPQRIRGVVLGGSGVAEIAEHSIAEVLGDVTSE